MNSTGTNRLGADMLDSLMGGREDEHLEFKEARNSFEFEDLVKYCAALSNEGGGKIVLGVTDRRPRTIVGSSAFPDLERTKAGLVERLHLRIQVKEIQLPTGRVLIFEAPPRPIGMPIQYKGAYWNARRRIASPDDAGRAQAHLRRRGTRSLRRSLQWSGNGRP